MIESGLKSLRSLIYVRQLNFYKRFKSNLHEGGARCEAMDIMTNSPTQYIKHYVNLENQYQGSKDVYKKFVEQLKSNIRKKAEYGCYKFQMYLKLNPQFRAITILK